mmetsp:Transcript_40608/g.46170  ORF Transcript_40608/g.46170 Transcript_40608/m.46170 type:complete len:893 (+) Transcript_40608:147-2825(+)
MFQKMIHKIWSSRIITLSLLLLLFHHGINASDDTTESATTPGDGAMLPDPDDDMIFPPPPDDIAFPPVLSPKEPETGSLTASDIDDNLNFITYMIYARKIYAEDSNPSNERPLIPIPGGPGGRPETGLEISEPLIDELPPSLPDNDEEQQQYLLPSPDLVENRLSIQVTDNSNNAFSCAEVEISTSETNTNSDINVVRLSTGTDGKLAVFPHKSIDNLGDGPWNLVAKSPDGTSVGNTVIATADDLENEIELQINAPSSKPNAMDLAIVLDTTGSMCDELNFLQDELDNVLSLFLQRLGRIIDLRVAVVFYKDEGDVYVVSETDFTDIDSAMRQLKSEMCNGGGDYPEAVHSAWERASDLDWRGSNENVARVAFLIGDAPPHRPQIQSAFEAALRLRANGVRLYGLAASDTNDVLEYLLRMVALLSHGRHMWLTNDSGIGNSKADAKVACFQVTELEKLLIRVLLGEMEGRRFEPNSEDIIREFGSSQGNGICIIDMNDPEASLKPSGNDFTSSDGGGPSGGKPAFSGGTEDAVAFLPRPPDLGGSGGDADGGDGGGGGLGDDFMTSGDDGDDFIDIGDGGGGEDDGGNSTILVCFPGDSLVYVNNKGPVLMKDLKLGDEVLVTEDSNSFDRNSFSPVYSFGHYNPNVEAEYIQIDYYNFYGKEEWDKKEDRRQLKLSKDHMVFVLMEENDHEEGLHNNKKRAIPASSVAPGDRLVLSSSTSTNGQHPILSAIVTKTSVTRAIGAYAPFTLTGTISVNGVLASNYVSLLNNNKKNSATNNNALLLHYEQFLAHSFQAPHRITCHISWSLCKKTETYNSEGISHWVSTPLAFFQWLLFHRSILQTMLVVPAIFGIALFLSFMEFMIFHWLSFVVVVIGLTIIAHNRKGCLKST